MELAGREESIYDGCIYYSDEFAVIDANGTIYPYARPLSLRIANGPSPIRVKAEQLGGCAGDAAIPPGWVVVAPYQAGATWAPRPLTAGRLMLALTDNAVPARLRPAEVIESLSGVAMQARGLSGVRGETNSTVTKLLDLLQSPS